MKTKFKLFIIVWIALTATSCYDVLEQTPTDRYTDAVVWNDPILLEAHLAKLYSFTPVMVNDAPGVLTGWYGSDNPVNVDGFGLETGSLVYILGFTVNGEGPTRTMDITDETKYNLKSASHNHIA